ncbi:sugar ABC transporter permease, partial [Microtetraspora sp. AC03309]|nr:sugar ABC transporter permease [Microtetraspora sp. AC03309]
MNVSTGRVSGTARVAAAGVDGARGRRGRPDTSFRKFLTRHWYAWAMTAPVIIVTCVLVGWPLVRGIYLSLTDATEANVGRTIGVNVIPATY